jgi:hypothetical protein
MQTTSHLIKHKNRNPSRLQQYISGALLATDIALAIQFLQLPSLSQSLTVALWCITLSAPGLAFDFILDMYTTDRGYTLYVFPSLRYESFYIVLVLVALTAIAAAIHHFIPFAAYTFIAMSALAFYRLRKYVSALEAELEKKSDMRKTSLLGESAED